MSYPVEPSQQTSEVGTLIIPFHSWGNSHLGIVNNSCSHRRAGAWLKPRALKNCGAFFHEWFTINKNSPAKWKCNKVLIYPMFAIEFLLNIKFKLQKKKNAEPEVIALTFRKCTCAAMKNMERRIKRGKEASFFFSFSFRRLPVRSWGCAFISVSFPVGPRGWWTPFWPKCEPSRMGHLSAQPELTLTEWYFSLKIALYRRLYSNHKSHLENYFAANTSRNSWKCPSGHSLYRLNKVH